jgi:hypothetical protein
MREHRYWQPIHSSHATIRIFPRESLTFPNLTLRLKER